MRRGGRTRPQAPLIQSYARRRGLVGTIQQQRGRTRLLEVAPRVGGVVNITRVTAGGAPAAAAAVEEAHQYFFAPDAAPGVDVVVGAQITKHATSGAAETVTRITVHSGLAGGGGALVFDIEQGNDEDQDAGGFAWVLFKTVTVPAGQLTFVDAAPAVATTARRPLRINVTAAPAGWRDVNIIMEVLR